MPTISPARTSSDASSSADATARRSHDHALKRQHRSPGVARLAAACGTSRPTIRARQRARRSASATGWSATLPPVPQHRDAIGDRQHLAELVRDEDDARCRLAASRRSTREQAVDLAAASARRSARRGSGCGRRDRAPSGSRPAAARRRRARRPARRDRPRGRSRPRAARACAAPRDAQPAAPEQASVPSTMFSRTREALGQREMLVHHADAGRERGVRRAGGSGRRLRRPSTAIVPASAT